MTIRHENEKKQFKKLFRQQGLDQFNKRFRVLEIFLTTDEHITIEELSVLLKENGEDFTDNFIAGTMELLCKYGFAKKIEFNNGVTRFEHRHLGLHHDHMICTKCGKIIEFRDEELESNQSRMAQAYGFHMLQHKMEIYGICSECLKQRKLILSLDHFKQGEKVVVVDFTGGQNVAERLSSMGIRKGVTIEIVSTQAGGQIVAAVDESRFVIGRGMAAKVLVESKGDPDRHIADNRKTIQATDFKKLSSVKQGQKCTVAKISGEPKLRRRLLEMGVNRGAEVYVEKYAPLKDPLEIVIKGGHLSLRVEEASHISVEDVRNTK